VTLRKTDNQIRSKANTNPYKEIAHAIVGSIALIERGGIREIADAEGL
jgi:hypothetical protein